MKKLPVCIEDLPAVILAAGQGERLRQGDSTLPKPMKRLLGLSLLERSVLACRDAGVRRFFIVVGYKREQVAQHVVEIGHRYRINVCVVENPSWGEGNGTSVLAVRPFIQGPFLLLMADHVIDSGIIRDLVAAGNGSSSFLAVDRRTHKVYDIEDATKVSLHGTFVKDINKGLPSFDAVDTGIFLCRSPVFEALERSLKKGDGSLSGGMRDLSRRRGLRAVDIGDRSWTDVDTPLSLTFAAGLLLASASRSRSDGPVARRLNRPLSRRLSSVLAETPLRANHLSLISFAIGLGAAISFSLGQYWWFLLGGLLTQLTSILDGCDGEIARLKFQSTKFGAWLDTLLDRYADVALIAGAAHGRWGDYPDQLVLLGSVVAAMGFVVFSYARKEYFLRFAHELPESPGYRFLPASRDVRLFIIAVGAVLGRPFLAALLAGLVAHAAVLLRFVTVHHKRE